MKRSFLGKKAITDFFNMDTYIAYCIEYHCNNDCVICMLSNLKRKLIALNFEMFKLRFIENKKLFPFKKNIILSGGEATLNPQLLEYVEFAKKNGAVNIRIQTNGRKLADYRTAKRLKSAGINEFFVSIHDIDTVKCQSISRRSTSCSETLKGFLNLHRINATTITNTVVTSENFTSLPSIANYLAAFRNVSETHFWNYLAVNHHEHKITNAPFAKTLPYLTKAIDILKKSKKNIVIKYFPECLLSKYAKYLNNSQPELILGIDQCFWDQLKSCDFKKCIGCSSQKCEGLTKIYRTKALS